MAGRKQGAVVPTPAAPFVLPVAMHDRERQELQRLRDEFLEIMRREKTPRFLTRKLGDALGSNKPVNAPGPLRVLIWERS